MGKSKPLRIIKKLPQIILPNNKKEMFLKWYDEDLRFQDEIPQTFEKGYLMMDNMFEVSSNLKDNFKNLIKEIAIAYKITYREAENNFNKFIQESEKATIYFEFKESFLHLDLYFKEQLINCVDLDLKSIKKEVPNPKVIDKIIEMYNKSENLYNMYGYYALIYVECVLWYLATTQKTTKYYRDEKVTPIHYEKKEIVNPKKNKIISTPIYDMNKIKKVKTESLIKRRKGWTYSHSFQVHGHYRHYSNGKVIFINPFIKGKGKEEISQTIILNPKEV